MIRQYAISSSKQDNMGKKNVLLRLLSFKDKRRNVKKEVVDTDRRRLLSVVGAVAATAVVKAETGKIDRGMAYIEGKKIPKRSLSPVPAGAVSVSEFSRRCTSCGKCVDACPNGVLRMSTGLSSLLQPEMSFGHGACSIDCTRCSDVCAEGAILPLTAARKASTQIGHAVWVKQNCAVTADGDDCGLCARRCPSGAITMAVAYGMGERKVPIVNTERCIGCGICESICPARPFTAIYVEGHQVHRTI
jgi:formate hydrogenlyase subunit 6/NADH:ubiquinone oxidoreductase subunit I